MSNNALSTLQSILLESPSEIIHDATIQRLKISINQKASSSINRKSFLQALQVDLITPEDVIIDLSMIDDRNLTTILIRKKWQKIPG